VPKTVKNIFFFISSGCSIGDVSANLTMRPLPLSGYLITTNRATLHTTRATLNEQRRPNRPSDMTKLQIPPKRRKNNDREKLLNGYTVESLPEGASLCLHGWRDAAFR
jgi:hypothetical protein